MPMSATKLVLAIVQVEDVRLLTDRLVACDFGATRIDTAGGFLRRENAVVLIAADARELPCLYEIFRQTCRRRVVPWFPPPMDGMMPQIGQPIDVEVGGAVVFVVPVERVEHLGLPVRSTVATHAKEARREAAAIGA